jgi:ubiquinone/menaquinone biosynthesis C-methylase UbiE
MSEDRDSLNARQFGAHAQAYVASAVHSGGADLEALAERAAQAAPSHALDLGTGGGHVAYVLARAAKVVTAVDLSANMLAAVAGEARRRGLANIETVEARAETLPFPDAHFDFLATRFSAHHWRDARAGLSEARRVLRAGAPAVFIDVVAPEAPALDTFFQSIELLRDISHVRDYSRAEWRGMLARAGFEATAEKSWRLRMDFVDWTARIGTPAALAEAIRALQRQADEETRRFFAIESDGSFLLEAALFEAVAI